MANQNDSPVKALNKKISILSGLLTHSASGAVTSTYQFPSTDFLGAEIVKSATAEYTITLKATRLKLISASLTPMSGVTNANGNWKIKSVLNSAGTTAVKNEKVKSIVITCTNSAGVPTEQAVVGGVFITLFFKDTTAAG